MSDYQVPAKPSGPRAIETIADGKQLVSHLFDVMDAMLGTIEEETNLVRAGRITEAALLETTKANLARAYIADVQRLKANAVFLTERLPEGLDALRDRHDTFRALLQINLTVLATAHAVSESIIRGVASALARKSAPQTYGGSGRPSAPAESGVQPVAVSRTL